MKKRLNLKLAYLAGIFLYGVSYFQNNCFAEITGSKEQASSYQVISDIDDTIKITNVNVPYRAFYNGLIRKKVFLGMKELYQEFSKNSVKWSYVSASPQMLKSNLYSFLIKNKGFPFGEIFLCNWWQRETSAEFKLKTIREIVEQTNLPILMIGDDTESDPEVYESISKMLPTERVLKIYIHQIKGRSLPTSVIGYQTAFDIALSEVEEGRIDTSQAVKVGYSILKNNKLNYLFPDFVKDCPKNYEPMIGPVGANHRGINKVAMRLKAKVRNFCIEKMKKNLQ